MTSRRSRFLPACSPIGEALESRVVLSATGPAPGTIMVATPQASGHRSATTTTLAVKAGTLGQPVAFTATVSGPRSGTAPSGTVNFVENGTVIASAPVMPSNTSKPWTSSAGHTFTPVAGESSDFFGKHAVTAQFVPSGGFSRSVATRTFAIAQPAYTTLAKGVKYETIVPGSGAAIQSGQTANLFYAGYLAKGGKVFDDSAQHGGTPFSFAVGAGQVIPGFDAATVGMQTGETRIVEIPAAQGYGSTANGPIPANSALIFVLTLESIS